MRLTACLMSLCLALPLFGAEAATEVELSDDWGDRYGDYYEAERLAEQMAYDAWELLDEVEYAAGRSHISRDIETLAECLEDFARELSRNPSRSYAQRIASDVERLAYNIKNAIDRDRDLRYNRYVTRLSDQLSRDARELQDLVRRGGSGGGSGRGYVCEARDDQNRGRTYRGYGRTRADAEDEAMWQCQDRLGRTSCRITRCYRQ